MSKHSPNFDKVKKYFEDKLWSKKMVEDAAGRWITAAEVKEIIFPEPK